MSVVQIRPWAPCFNGLVAEFVIPLASSHPRGTHQLCIRCGSRPRSSHEQRLLLGACRSLVSIAVARVRGSRPVLCIAAREGPTCDACYLCYAGVKTGICSALVGSTARCYAVPLGRGSSLLPKSPAAPTPVPSPRHHPAGRAAEIVVDRLDVAESPRRATSTSSYCRRWLSTLVWTWPWVDCRT